MNEEVIITCASCSQKFRESASEIVYTKYNPNKPAFKETWCKGCIKEVDDNTAYVSGDGATPGLPSFDLDDL